MKNEFEQNLNNQYDKSSYIMVIHIALVGRESGHIWDGLKEIIPVDKLYLLHSANDDFYKYTDEAKKLKKEVEKRAKELLIQLGLENRIEHKPNELSGGEQQRVSVARALINDPALILADEPSGNLDSKTAKELHQLFFDLRDKFQQTFVIVTHNEDLAKMADRTLVMKDGLIV